MTVANDKVLKVNFYLPGEIKSGQACEMKVEIINISGADLVVNKRLAVGYRKSQSRELFVSFFKTGSDKNAAIQKNLYERKFSQKEDFIQLKPNKKIDTKFNLFEWYDFPEAGNYDIIVCYQADEDLAYQPVGLCKGIFCSEKKTVTFIETV